MVRVCSVAVDSVHWVRPSSCVHPQPGSEEHERVHTQHPHVFRLTLQTPKTCTKERQTDREGPTAERKGRGEACGGSGGWVGVGSRETGQRRAALTFDLKIMAKNIPTQITTSRRIKRFLVALFWYFSADSRFLTPAENGPDECHNEPCVAELFNSTNARKPPSPHAGCDAQPFHHAQNGAVQSATAAVHAHLSRRFVPSSRCCSQYGPAPCLGPQPTWPSP